MQVHCQNDKSKKNAFISRWIFWLLIEVGTFKYICYLYLLFSYTSCSWLSFWFQDIHVFEWERELFWTHWFAFQRSAVARIAPGWRREPGVESKSPPESGSQFPGPLLLPPGVCWRLEPGVRADTEPATCNVHHTGIRQASQPLG